ncbi:MAG: hypothetical protein K2P85_00025, partial [Flavobacteriaceae bacterium]|nr:hypothetical protein [Flavobacteriaceae bacterium]
LQGKLMRNDINKEEHDEYLIKKSQLEEFGFYEEVEDKWFQMYLAEMSKHEIIQKIEFTEEEKQMLEQESKKVVEEILKKMNNLE